MKFGLEKEFFVLKDGAPIMVPATLAFDESGLLAEARGEPASNVVEAVFSLRASIYRLEKSAEKAGVVLSDAPVMKIGKSEKIKASRAFAKGLTKYENLYGHDSHRNSIAESTAGIHISFTNPQTRYAGTSPVREAVNFNAPFDFVKVFRALDSAFQEEIKNSKRRPGFYEFKPDGRIEYRSLPANTDLDKIIHVLQALI